MDKKFNIKVISDSCGVRPQTLRAWEQRYQVFNPERSEGGQRLYSEGDLLKAKYLSFLTANGHSISQLSKYSVEQLKELFEDQQEDSETTTFQTKKIVQKNLLKYLQDYKIDKISEELQLNRLKLGVKDFVFEIVLPIMREIGELVDQEVYTISQEHLISSLVRDQLSQIDLPNIGEKRKEMVLATPEGNLHELSIIIADIICKASRVPTRYLGAAHPAECLGEALNVLKSPFLILGVVSSDNWDYQKQIIPYLKQVDQALNFPVEIVIVEGVRSTYLNLKISKRSIFMDLLIISINGYNLSNTN